MFDIHYHLLFGVDDGPADIDAAVQLAEASIAEGVTHIVATPHADGDYVFQPDVNRERLAALQKRLGNRVTLGHGCDFHLSSRNIEDFEREPRKYTINGTQYLLVEFPEFGIPAGTDQTFAQMLSAGFTPIITHPERNQELARNPARLAPWVEMGCLVQITAASFEGRFGQKAQSVAYELVRLKRVHVVASDAHSVKGRPPAMKVAFTLLAAKFGLETARGLCVENPGAIFHGRPTPFWDVSEEERIPEPPRRAGLFTRLLGRV